MAIGIIVVQMKRLAFIELRSLPGPDKGQIYQEQRRELICRTPFSGLSRSTRMMTSFSSVCLSNFCTRATLGTNKAEWMFIQSMVIYWAVILCTNLGIGTILRKRIKSLTLWSWHCSGVKGNHVRSCAQNRNAVKLWFLCVTVATTQWF